MRRRGAIAALAVGVAALGIAAFALAGGSGAGFNHLTATMSGYQETPAAISSMGTAQFTADVSKDGQSISWQMTYGDLEGEVTQSHIHFGQRGITGGISVFLCTNLDGPAGTQTCPQSGTISGTITAADVSPPIPATLAARNQGINTGEYVELVKAIDAGKTYANLHTTIWPSGEIRAQLNEGDPHN
jgi:hypothetical protein